jgi:hypothetical protein
MINGWLDLGGGRKFIVEVQLHLRVLYELKSDLHVLYAGARVLGAMETSTTKHEGVLSADVSPIGIHRTRRSGRGWGRVGGPTRAHR